MHALHHVQLTEETVTRQKRLVRLHKQVEEAMGTNSPSEPLATPAAIAGLYALGNCTPEDAFEYLELVAEMASRLNEELDADDTRNRMSVLLGSSLHNFGAELPGLFADPARSGKTRLQ